MIYIIITIAVCEDMYAYRRYLLYNPGSQFLAYPALGLSWKISVGKIKIRSLKIPKVYIYWANENTTKKGVKINLFYVSLFYFTL